jgi:oxygen-independent coproporphyrinogen-3 oxidase
MMCNLSVDWPALSERLGLDVRAHLSDALETLRQGPEADFVIDDGRRLELTERGRPFVRNVAQVFDAYREDRVVGSRSI